MPMYAVFLFWLRGAAALAPPAARAGLAPSGDGSGDSWPLRDVVLFAGQSNVVGVAETSEMTHDIAHAPPHVFAWPKDGGKKWNPYVPTEMNGFNLHNRFGPEASFVHEVAKHYEDFHERFGVLKVGMIGTNLARDWAPIGWEKLLGEPSTLRRRTGEMMLEERQDVDGLLASIANGTLDEVRPPKAPFLFALLVESARNALKSPQCEKSRCTARALVWVQGEADANEAADGRHYLENLEHFMPSLRKALDSPDLFLVIAQLAPDLAGCKNRPGAEGVLRAQSAFVEKEGTERAALVPTDGVTKREDRLHYDGKGYIDLGKRLASAYLASPAVTRAADL
mmetsp:Transcript_94070/g.265666  ORF Transcript_94070/g.265666 Transcript_94070/m.265666 type:complete len:339 (-) Transcript_94070:48-1064(-)